MFAPENGNMLGGTMVNLTGPCFVPGTRVTCRFNSQDSDGIVIDENRASCIMPTFTEAEGWVDFEVSLNGGPYYWKGKFYVGRSKKMIFCLMSYFSFDLLHSKVFFF